MNCKNCGAELFEQNAVDGVIECEYCFSRHTLPKKAASPAALEFMRMGEHDLDTGRFDDAYAAYEKAAEIDKEEPEACFGMALALFKVQYIKDEVNNRLQPICHELTEKRFQEDSRYLSALRLGTEAQKKEYQKRAEEIDYIRNEFVELKNSGLDFDCFLCVKVTGADGEKTEDSKDADYIYDLLKDRGFKPFYSERNIRNRTGADYEAMILYALHTAETMLVICREEDYLQTPWVKNEYARFLRLLNDSEKESDAVTIVYYENPIEKLAGKRGKIQGIDFSRRDADRKICDFVESHTAEAKLRRQREEEEKRKREEKLLKEIEEQRKAREEERRAREEAEARLKTVQGGGMSAMQQILSGQIDRLTEESRKVQGKEKQSGRAGYLVRARQELLSEDWDKAKEYFDLFLNDDPENGEAWLGLFLISRQKKSAREFTDASLSLEEARRVLAQKYFTRAEQYGTGKILEDIKSIRAYCEGIIEAAQRKREEEETRRSRLEYERENDPSVENYNRNEFDIERTEDGFNLKKYKGKRETIFIPRGIASIGDEAFYGCSLIDNVTIPDSVKTIGNSAFLNCNSLTSVTLSNAVTKIGTFAFSGCRSLTNISIPNSVSSIGSAVFSGCISLIDITIPDSVRSVGSNAFSGCISLTSITIPDSVTSIAKEAFYNCSSLEKIIYTGDVEGWCGISGLGDLMRYGKSDKTLYIGGKEITGHLQIPNGLSSISDNAFYNCSLITSVTISDSVTSIGKYAFLNCSSLTSVTMGNKVASIGYYAFSGCSSLTGIKLPNSVTNIGSNAFARCSSLANISIPENVTNIGSNAFIRCSSLTNIIIPNSVISIGGGSFECCTSLTNVTIPKRFKKDRKKIFSDCGKIKFTFTK